MRSVMPNSSSRSLDGSWASNLSNGCTASVSGELQGCRNLTREENGQINKRMQQKNRNGREDTDVTLRAVKLVLEDVALTCTRRL